MIQPSSCALSPSQLIDADVVASIFASQHGNCTVTDVFAYIDPLAYDQGQSNTNIYSQDITARNRNGSRASMSLNWT